MELLITQIEQLPAQQAEAFASVEATQHKVHLETKILELKSIMPVTREALCDGQEKPMPDSESQILVKAVVADLVPWLEPADVFFCLLCPEVFW